MKRIMLSLFTIAAVAVMATGATSAYFSDTKVVAGNTFSTGTVTLGDLSATHLNVTNLAPGVWSNPYNVDIPYTGSLQADLFVGARGTSGPNDDAYLGDETRVVIKDRVSGVTVFDGKVQVLSTVWTQLAWNTSAGTKYFELSFMLDADAENQGVTNSDTEILVYAVQAGTGHMPATVPYLTTP